MEMFGAAAEVITPFQPKLVRINGIPHLLTTAESTLPQGMHPHAQTPLSIPQQPSPYWRASVSSQAPPTGIEHMPSVSTSLDSSYVFNRYFHQRKTSCTVGFHPSISTTSFKHNITARPQPIPVIDAQSSTFLQLDIQPYHMKPFPEAELLSVELLLALLISFDRDPELIERPLIMHRGNRLDSVLLDKESSVARSLLKNELYAKFIGVSTHSRETDHHPSSPSIGSSSTGLPDNTSESVESDPEQSHIVSDGELEFDSETETEDTMNIDEGLIPSVIPDQTISTSSGTSSSSSSSTSTSSSLHGIPTDSVQLVSTVAFPLFQPGGITTPTLSPERTQLIDSRAPTVVPPTPPIGWPTPFSHIPGMSPYASVFSPCTRHVFPQFPDVKEDASSLWNHIRKLVEFVLQEVNCNLQLTFISLLQTILPKENHCWINPLATLYQKRLTWFERNQLFSFGDEMTAFSNGTLPERIVFQVSSIICLARISEASCERNVSRARAVFDRHKDHTLPQVANGLLLMSYQSLYKKLKSEKYFSQ